MSIKLNRKCDFRWPMCHALHLLVFSSALKSVLRNVVGNQVGQLLKAILQSRMDLVGNLIVRCDPPLDRRCWRMPIELGLGGLRWCDFRIICNNLMLDIRFFCNLGLDNNCYIRRGQFSECDIIIFFWVPQQLPPRWITCLRNAPFGL